MGICTLFCNKCTLFCKKNVFAELQVRKSLGNPHTEEADPIQFRVPAGKTALHREHCWVGALENSRFL